MFKYDLTFIDMFGGIGGGSLGLERAGWKCVWYSDKFESCNIIYEKHYGDIKRDSRPIRQVDAKEVPDHTLLVAGFPCQSFSFAGERKGFEDKRGTLFFDIARIAKVKRPALLLLENVRGLLSTQKGYCFFYILQTLDGLGYDVEWQVLNSKYFGVPQSRPRTYIIGHLRTKPTRQIFPIGEDNSTYFPNEEDKEKRLILLSHTKANIKQREQQRTDTWTLDTSSSKMGIYEGNRIRIFTPLERERLQGFPDGWTSGLSDTERYKVLGNAMTVNVMEFLGKRLIECLNQ